MWLDRIKNNMEIAGVNKEKMEIEHYEDLGPI